MLSTYGGWGSEGDWDGDVSLTTCVAPSSGSTEDTDGTDS